LSASSSRLQESSLTSTHLKTSKASCAGAPSQDRKDSVQRVFTQFPSLAPEPSGLILPLQAPCDDGIKNHSRKSTISAPDKKVPVSELIVMKDLTGRSCGCPRGPLRLFRLTRDRLFREFCDRVIPLAYTERCERFGWAIAVHRGPVRRSSHGEYRLPTPATAPVRTAVPRNRHRLSRLFFHQRKHLLTLFNTKAK